MNWTIFGETHSKTEWKSMQLTKEDEVQSFLSEWWNSKEHIEVESSGSTGIPKKILLPKTLMKLSARATAEFFGLGKGSSALLCLPVKYIGGKMMVVRADVNNWELDCIKAQSKPQIPKSGSYDFCSMTPMQCLSLLRENRHSLNNLKILLLGGSGVSNELQESLQDLPVKVFLGFGMTETSSHVALRILNGDASGSDHYRAIGDYSFSLGDASELIIHYPSLGLIWETHDVVELIDEKTFRWLGRLDNVINSGGVKIHPEQLEKEMEKDLNFPFYLSSKTDPLLGEKLVLVFEGKVDRPKREEMIQKAVKKLSGIKRPREIVALDKIEKTPNGKLKRKKL